MIIIYRNIDRKRKKLMVFKVFLKNKWKRGKLTFNRLLHDIRRNNFLKPIKIACFYFSNLFSCFEISPKTHSVWQVEREEKWLGTSSFYSDIQLQ